MIFLIFIAASRLAKAVSHMFSRCFKCEATKFFGRLSADSRYRCRKRSMDSAQSIVVKNVIQFTTGGLCQNVRITRSRKNWRGSGLLLNTARIVSVVAVSATFSKTLVSVDHVVPSGDVSMR